VSIATDAARPVAAGTGPEEQPTSRIRVLVRRVAARWRQLAVVCFLLGSIGAAATTYLGPHRDDRDTAAAASQAVDAAEQGSVALLSYAPDSLERDLADARSHLTGDFLTYYSKFADEILVPAARQQDVHASATVVRAATIAAHPDTAEVLVFLNQNTSSRDNPAPVQTASSVKVGLTKVEGNWRISSFDPV
jgi:Mce-associated membrane protein